MIRRLAVLLTAVVASLGLATPALAYAPVEVVHTEQVAVGPYKLAVGFSTWPIRAMRSLDFTFLPDGGIAGRSGTLTVTGAGTATESDGEGGHRPRLARHPRKRDSWGLDVRALNDPGTYTFTFTIDGPQGHGEGAVAVEVLDQPGPPLALSWAVGTLPGWGLIALVLTAWRRVRPGRQPLFTR
jgi:hypothetical protein